MKCFISTLFFFIAFLVEAQTTDFKVVYSFNSNFSGEIVEGNEFIQTSDALAGGSFLQNISCATDGVESVLASDVVNNNATNYINTFIRCDITSLPGKSIVITKITVRQRANSINTNNIFRIGCTKNGSIPINTDINQSTLNIPFSQEYSSTSFIPGTSSSSATNMEKLSVFLCARGSSTTTVNWKVDEIIIEGVANTGSISNVIYISNTTKQQMRFGVDAERLWYWRSELKNELAELAVKELQSDYVRVAINCAYEREQGIKTPAAYVQILEMMTAMKTANPSIKFFASERPLDEAYTPAEELAIFGTSDGCPWAPYPAWIMGFSGYGGVFGGDGFNKDEALQYLADYLNFMNSKGFSIDYMDLTNEKQIITPSIAKYMYDNLPAKLNGGVKIPAFVVPSSWSRQQGIDWLKSVNISQHEDKAFAIAGTHNTDPAGTAEDFVVATNALNKEAWNTELHGWVGIAMRDEILNSSVFWEHIRAGFTGIDSWLFYGPLNGKDHTLIWSNTNQIIKSGKYEIFKKVVNNANRGYYVETSIPNSQCITASFIKDSILTVWVLNKSTLPIPDVLFSLHDRNISNNSIEVTRWNSSLVRQGVVSSFIASHADNFTFSLDSASLYCFKIDLSKSVLSVNENKFLNELILYPNPTSASFFVKTDRMIEKMEILDLNGRIIKGLNPTEKVVSVSDMKSGMYFFRLFFDNQWQYEKLLIVK